MGFRVWVSPIGIDRNSIAAFARRYPEIHPSLKKKNDLKELNMLKKYDFCAFSVCLYAFSYFMLGLGRGLRLFRRRGEDCQSLRAIR
jgi:hypothetical protein